MRVQVIQLKKSSLFFFKKIVLQNKTNSDDASTLVYQYGKK